MIRNILNPPTKTEWESKFHKLDLLVTWNLPDISCCFVSWKTNLRMLCGIQPLGSGMMGAFQNVLMEKVLTSIVSSNVSMSAKDNQFLAQNWSILEQKLEFLFTWKEYCCALETLSKLTFFSYLTTPPKTPYCKLQLPKSEVKLEQPFEQNIYTLPFRAGSCSHDFCGFNHPWL